MTDLDRLLELAKEIKYAGLDTEKEKLEYQSLYEKLKKAEEFYNGKDNYLIFTDKEFAVKEFHNLKQNQKTPEDIEKIKFVDALGDGWKDIIEFVKSSKKEIQQLKEEVLHLSALLETPEKELHKQALYLLERIYKKNREINKLKQDSKTNAEIVEKIRNWHNSTQKSLYEENWSVGDVQIWIQKNYNQLQSILKEIKNVN